MPNLPLTVPREFYDCIAVACGEMFADSYLSGGELHGMTLLPRTHKAWERLTENRGAMDALRRAKVVLKEPPYFNAAVNVQLARAA
jgi:hypothetical protein